MKQTCILVLGMNCSGTSTLMRALGMLDVSFDNELLKTKLENEKDFFQNSKILRINEELFSICNSSWDDTCYDIDKLVNISSFVKLKKDIKHEFKYSDTLVIKDSKLAFMFPVYKKALEELNINIKVICSYRNPIEVVTSLNDKDEMSLEKGMLLWAYHFLLAEKFSRSYPRVFVDFDALIGKTENTLQSISNALYIDLDKKYLKYKKEVDDTLEISLKYHSIPIKNLSNNVPNIVKNILKLKDKFNTPNITENFDILRDELFSYQKLFYNDEMLNDIKEFQEMNEALNVKNEIIKAQEDVIESLKDELVLFYEDSNSILSKVANKIQGWFK